MCRHGWGNERPSIGCRLRPSYNITPIISARRCPILQDISGDIAQILSHSANTPPEETMNNLSNAADLNTLHVTRAEIFMHAIGCILESGEMDPSTLLRYKLKQRRGRNAKASVALDIVWLFNYVRGVKEFPLCVLASNGLASTPLPGVSQNNFHHSLTPIPESSILGESADPLPHLSSPPWPQCHRTCLVPKWAAPGQVRRHCHPKLGVTWTNL